MAAPRTLSPAEAERWTRIGLLSALALLLGYLESFLPIPIPGVRLGLANIPVLVALDRHDATGACWVPLVKVAATSLLFGNPVTLAYSLAGTTLSLALMTPLSLLPTMRLKMVSVAGALAHEAGQLAVAQALLGTALVWYGAPALGVAGCLTGLLCGVAARRTADLLRAAEGGQDGPIARPAAGGRQAEPQRRPRDVRIPSHGAGRAGGGIRPRRAVVACLLAYLALVLGVMHARTLAAAGVWLAAACGAVALARVRPQALVRSLRPALPFALVALVAQAASATQGMALLRLGPLALTRETLLAAGLMLARLVAVTMASVALAGALGPAGLARCAALLLAPLERCGLDAAGPRLALSTALSLLPRLASELEAPAGRQRLWSRAFWTRQLPEVVGRLLTEARGLAEGFPAEADVERGGC